MKTATNIYIFNLALADALATSTLPFQSAKYLMNTWPFGEVLCKLIIAIDYYNMFTSIFTLTMMSVDRYIAVCHPVRALEFRTPVKAKIINVLIWVVSSAIGVPIMIMAVTKVNDNGEIFIFFLDFFFIIYQKKKIFMVRQCKQELTSLIGSQYLDLNALSCIIYIIIKTFWSVKPSL